MKLTPSHLLLFVALYVPKMMKFCGFINSFVTSKNVKWCEWCRVLEKD